MNLQDLADRLEVVAKNVLPDKEWRKHVLVGKDENSASVYYSLSGYRKILKEYLLKNDSHNLIACVVEQFDTLVKLVPEIDRILTALKAESE